MAKTAGHTWADYKTEIAQDLNMLQRTNATTNECYNERMLQRTNATTNEYYNERMLQQTVSIDKIMVLQ